MNAAEICRDKGWGAGTQIVGDEGYGPTVIEITAVGEQSILAKCISHNGTPTPNHGEMIWTLSHRDWQPVEGSEPEGTGFGKPWVPQIGVTFLANGALVRSLLDLTEGHEREGLVGMDVTGKWNHAAKDTLSIIAHPDVAEEWGRFLIAGAEAARKDAESAPPVGTQP